MFFQQSADVLACNNNPDTGMVEALDCRNADKGHSNNPDEDQSEISLIFGSSENGTIDCK